MRFLVDHDVPSEIARVLREAGHHVTLVKETPGATAEDVEVLEYAIDNNLVVLTCNRDDFLRLCSGRDHCGLIILVRRRTRIAECAAVLKLLAAAGKPGIAGNVNFA